jgi:hypothetical protein
MQSGAPGLTRTTNLLGRLFGERAPLKLMYAALIRACQTWRSAAGFLRAYT